MMPRGRLSATVSGVLACDGFEVGPEPAEVHRRRSAEDGHHRLGAHEPVPPERGELADWNPVARHDKRLALVEPAHDLAALVAKLPLGDLP